LTPAAAVGPDGLSNPLFREVPSLIDLPAQAIAACDRAAASATHAGNQGDARAELWDALSDSAEGASALAARFESLAARATAIAQDTDFRLVYDSHRNLFAIGFNVATGQLDASSYDLLASEARLASLVAIALGQVPQAHWFRLGRQLGPTPGRGRALLSWSGTMFEYLMPLLVTRTYEQTLLNETYRSVVARQVEYASRRGVPWGTSESAYNTMDLALNYQYRAFGVPGLGLKPGLAEDLVVCPTRRRWRCRSSRRRPRETCASWLARGWKVASASMRRLTTPLTGSRPADVRSWCVPSWRTTKG